MPRPEEKSWWISWVFFPLLLIIIVGVVTGIEFAYPDFLMFFSQDETTRDRGYDMIYKALDGKPVSRSTEFWRGFAWGGGGSGVIILVCWVKKYFSPDQQP